MTGVILTTVKTTSGHAVRTSAVTDGSVIGMTTATGAIVIARRIVIETGVIGSAIVSAIVTETANASVNVNVSVRGRAWSGNASASVETEERGTENGIVSVSASGGGASVNAMCAEVAIVEEAIVAGKPRAAEAR